MQRKSLVSTLAASGMLLVAARMTFADDKPAASAKPSPAPAAKTEATPKPDKPAEPAGKKDAPEGAAEWAAMSQPNEHHQRLAKFIGKWKVEATGNIPGEDTPRKFSGTAEYEAILGGRYITEHVICNMDGTPFEWHGCLGYDNAKKKFFAAWVDNMGTGLDQAEGEADATGSVITLKGEQTDMDGSKSKYSWIMTLPDTGEPKIEMHQPGPDGKEITVMTFAFQRVSPS